MTKSLHLTLDSSTFTVKRYAAVRFSYVGFFVSVKAQVHFSDLLKGNHICLHLKVKDQLYFLNYLNTF